MRLAPPFYLTLSGAPFMPLFTKPLPALPPAQQATRWIATLGGFLARKNDGPPGVTVFWRGWQRLADISSTWLIFHPT